MNDTAKQEDIKTIAPARQTFSLTPSSLDEAMRFSQMIAKSDICPKDFKDKPGNVLVAVQMGAEVGLQPMQALQNIAVINGRPCIWGDALPALAKSHPKHEYMHEEFDDATMTAACEIKRKGEPKQVKTFSQKDAQQAGLWDKQGPWKTYPKRMLQMRARAWAIRDVFPDALRGIQVAEEIMDIPAREMGEAEVVTEPKELPPYSEEAFEKNLPAWHTAIAEGKRTVDEIIAMVLTKGTLTHEQKARIDNVPKTDAAPKDEFIEEYEQAEKAQEKKQ